MIFGFGDLLSLAGRKSIFALVGAASHPLDGNPAIGCDLRQSDSLFGGVCEQLRLLMDAASADI